MLRCLPKWKRISGLMILLLDLLESEMRVLCKRVGDVVKM